MARRCHGPSPHRTALAALALAAALTAGCTARRPPIALIEPVYADPAPPTVAAPLAAAPTADPDLPP